MCEQSRGKSSGVQNLVRMFENKFSFSHSHSADEANTQENTFASPSARMKRRSFAKKQKSAITHTGGASSLGSTDLYPSSPSKPFNRKAALRRPSNARRSMDTKVQFSIESAPGDFSPRTSLKRQKSISAESLAEIRSSTTSGSIQSRSSSQFSSDDALYEISDGSDGKGCTWGGLVNRSAEKASPEMLLKRLLRNSVKKEAEAAVQYEKQTLDRSVSDSTGLKRQPKSRFVSFSSEVSADEASIKRLVRTPTPFWSQDSDDAFEEEGGDENGHDVEKSTI